MSEKTDGYAYYVLGVLSLVMVFNFLDRQILAILAEDIQADLGISDARLGFLYGTAFAVFFAVFGIPLARLADAWWRIRMVSLGLVTWSLMTALSGLSTSFLQLGAARIGVGIGEASAGPASHSVITDYFPIARRGMGLAVFSAGIFIVAGLGVFVGGAIVDLWREAYPDGQTPLGLAGWQVAFFVAGLPGLVLALWTASLREPVRGQSDGVQLDPSVAARPVRTLLIELGTIVPPFTFVHLARVAGSTALARNLVAFFAIVGLGYALIELTGDAEQWIALAIGSYAALSWCQALARRDPAVFKMIFRTPSLRFLTLGIGLLAMAAYSLGFWGPSFFRRIHGASASEAGQLVGAAAGIGGLLGTIAGGLLSDRWRRSSPNGRLYVALLAALLVIPLLYVLLTTPDKRLAYALNFIVVFVISLYVAPGLATVQDLMPPRMRATASASYILVLNFVGLALGPYLVGRLSEALGDLGLALRLLIVTNVIAAGLILLARRHLARDEATRFEHAGQLEA